MKTGLLKITLIALIVAFTNVLQAADPVTVHLANYSKCSLTYNVYESNGEMYVVTLAAGAEKTIVLPSTVKGCQVTDGSSAASIATESDPVQMIMCSHVCTGDIEIASNGEVSIFVVDQDDTN